MKKFTDWQNDEWLDEKNKKAYRAFVPMYRDQVKLLMQMIDPNEQLPPTWSIAINILYAVWQYGFTGQEKDISNLPEWAKVHYRLIAHTVRTSRTHAANKKKPDPDNPEDNNSK